METKWKLQMTADASQVKETIKEVKSETEQLVDGMKGGLMAGFGSYQIGARMVGMAKQAVTELMAEATQFISMSKRFNMPVESIQQFKRLAAETGVSMGILPRAMKGLEKTFADATTNTQGKKSKFLHMMGITPEQLKQGMDDSQSALMSIRALILSYEDEAVQDRIGQELFGTTYNQIKAMIYASDEALANAKANVHITPEANIEAASTLGKQMGGWWDDVKTFFEPLVPILSICAAIIKEILDMIVVIGQSIGVVTQMLYTGFINAMRTAYIMLLGLLKLWREWQRDKSEEGSKRWIDMNQDVSGIDQQILVSGKNIGNSWSNVYDKWAGKKDKGGERHGGITGEFADKAKLNWKDTKIAWNAVRSGDNLTDLKTEKEAIESRIALIKQEQELARRAYEMKQQKNGGRLGMWEESDYFEKMDTRARKLQELKNDLTDVNSSISELQPSKNPEVGSKKKDMEADKKAATELKRDFEDRKEQRDELIMDEKVVALAKEKIRLQKILAELKANTATESTEQQKVAQAELDNVSKQEASLIRKIKTETQKANEEIENSKRKLGEKIADWDAKQSREWAIKHGMSVQEADAIELEAEIHKLMKIKKLSEDAWAEAKKNPNRPDFLTNANKIDEEFHSGLMKTGTMRQKMLESPHTFTASDAAKKGWGGGIAIDPVYKMIDLQDKSNEFLSEQTAIMRANAGFETKGPQYGATTPKN